MDFENGFSFILGLFIIIEEKIPTSLSRNVFRLMYKVNANKHGHADVIFPSGALTIYRQFLFLEGIFDSAKQETEETKLINQQGPGVILAYIYPFRVVHCENSVISEHDIENTNVG
jgi:hypothetical protein